MKILQTLLILQLQLICTNSFADMQEEMVHFTDPVIQKEFKETLSKQNIPFREDKYGAIWYLYSKQSEVNTVERSIIRKYHPRNAVYIDDNDHVETLKRRFKEDKIDFNVFELSRKTVVTWNDEQNDKARTVIRELSDSFAQKHYERLLKERKNGK